MIAGPCSVIAPCLHPPAITELDASNGALPPWILLKSRVYFAHRDNSTTAEALTSRGDTIQVSICLASPPARSYICIHCPGLMASNFVGEPRVVRSQRQFLLLHLPFTWSTSGEVLRRSDELYMYQATQGKKPTLTRIPDHDPYPCLLMAHDLGVYCGDAGEYILAGLCPTPDAQGHELHMYSSVSKAWTMKPARLENPRADEEHLPIRPHKVIPLGGSLFGWVDLWKGIFVCNVLSMDPHHVLRFIPLPGVMPGNTSGHLGPWKIRDVTCSNGSLKFIEIVRFQIPDHVEEIVPPCNRDTIYDDQCLARPPLLEDLDKKQWLYGWRAIIWNRALFDDNCWRKGCEVHVDDILVENPHHPAMLTELDIAANSTLMNLLPFYPTLSIHGDDVVHMMSSCVRRRSEVQSAQMVSVDMRNKTLTSAPCPAFRKLDAFCPYFPCVLSNYLSNTPLHLETPQQIIGYYESHHEYANCTDPSYGNYQQSFQLQQQPTYRSNWAQQQPTYRADWPQQHLTYGPNLPGWTAAGSAYPVNAQPAYPVVNTTAFGRMVHPLPLNNYGMFQPPPPWAHMPPFNTMHLDISTPAAAGNPVLGVWHQNPRRHPPNGWP